MSYSCGHDEHKSVGVSVDSRPLYSWCLTVVEHDEHKSVGASVDSRPLYSWCLTVVDMMNTSQWERQLTAVLSTLGVLQLWDMRNTSRWERQFTAHGGPVFSIDWHPDERNWLASGGRDKLLKVKAPCMYCMYYMYYAITFPPDSD